jgi:hypothetical protein
MSEGPGGCGDSATKRWYQQARSSFTVATALHTVPVYKLYETSTLQSTAWSFIDFIKFSYIPSADSSASSSLNHKLSSIDNPKVQTKMPFTIKALVSLIALSTVTTTLPTTPANSSTELTSAPTDTTTEDAKTCKTNGKPCLSKWECCVSPSTPAREAKQLTGSGLLLLHRTLSCA